MSEHGRVLAVNRVRLGSELIGAHALGALSLAVEDGSDFDEFGGTLQVGDQTVTYTDRVDQADDTAVLALSTGLAAAADDGDPVLLWDASRDVQASEVYAEVEIDGESGGDPMSAIVAHHLIGDLPEGIRSLVGESVRIEEDGDDWIVVDVLGISETGGGPKWESNDPHTLTTAEVTAGTFTHTLLHSRIVAAHEFTAYVNGVALGPDRYTLDADAGVVTVTLAGWETTADDFRFHYAYRSGPVAPSAAPTSMYRAAVLADSPLAYYRLGEEAAATVMLDESNNNRNGVYGGGIALGTPGLLTGDADTSATVTAPAYGYGKVDYAAWMDCPTALTLEAIINLGGTSGDRTVVDRDLGTARVFQFRTSAGKLEFIKIGGTGGIVSAASSAGLTANTTYHVAATYDGSAIRLYINGALDSTHSAAGTLGTAVSPLSVGTGWAGGTGANPVAQPINGTVDEVAIYGTVLSGAQIAAHYAEVA